MSTSFSIGNGFTNATIVSTFDVPEHVITAIGAHHCDTPFHIVYHSSDVTYVLDEGTFEHCQAILYHMRDEEIVSTYGNANIWPESWRIEPRPVLCTLYDFGYGWEIAHGKMALI